MREGSNTPERKTKRIGNWLEEIPEDAEDGSDAEEIGELEMANRMPNIKSNECSVLPARLAEPYKSVEADEQVTPHMAASAKSDPTCLDTTRIVRDEEGYSTVKGIKKPQTLKKDVVASGSYDKPQNGIVIGRGKRSSPSRPTRSAEPSSRPKAGTPKSNEKPANTQAGVANQEIHVWSPSPPTQSAQHSIILSTADVADMSQHEGQQPDQQATDSQAGPVSRSTAIVSQPMAETVPAVKPIVNSADQRDAEILTLRKRLADADVELDQRKETIFKLATNNVALEVMTGSQGGTGPSATVASNGVAISEDNVLVMETPDTSVSPSDKPVTKENLASPVFNPSERVPIEEGDALVKEPTKDVSASPKPIMKLDISAPALIPSKVKEEPTSQSVQSPAGPGENGESSKASVHKNTPNTASTKKRSKNRRNIANSPESVPELIPGESAVTTAEKVVKENVARPESLVTTAGTSAEGSPEPKTPTKDATKDQLSQSGKSTGQQYVGYYFTPTVAAPATVIPLTVKKTDKPSITASISGPSTTPIKKEDKSPADKQTSPPKPGTWANCIASGKKPDLSLTIIPPTKATPEATTPASKAELTISEPKTPTSSKRWCDLDDEAGTDSAKEAADADNDVYIENHLRGKEASSSSKPASPATNQPRPIYPTVEAEGSNRQSDKKPNSPERERNIEGNWRKSMKP